MSANRRVTTPRLASQYTMLNVPSYERYCAVLCRLSRMVRSPIVAAISYVVYNYSCRPQVTLARMLANHDRAHSTRAKPETSSPSFCTIEHAQQAAQPRDIKVSSCMRRQCCAGAGVSTAHAVNGRKDVWGAGVPPAAGDCLRLGAVALAALPAKPARRDTH